MRQHEVPVKTRGYGWRAAEWLLGVFGGVAAFLGIFAMFGSESESIGLGGDLAWEGRRDLVGVEVGAPDRRPRLLGWADVAPGRRSVEDEAAMHAAW